MIASEGGESPRGIGAEAVIREAAETDLHDVLAIYNEVIANSTAVFSDMPVTLQERERWFIARQAAGYPVIVATDGSGVVGFGSFGDFRTWPGYRFTVEHSVHVRADRRGAGVGTMLLTSLIARASALGKHSMIAGVDADNLASIRLHERLGFTTVARLSEVAWKFDRWLDLMFLQRPLP
ncbi:MAG TPA: GNAT family N-acetyltransferase [Solirubrobacteraceae bacterium]|jgi:phosphinothricin acetyltransferase